MYQLTVTDKAKKELKKLPIPEQKRVILMLRKIRENPKIGKRMEGVYQKLFTVRFWPYRILYEVSHEKIVVTVVRIGHRKDVYQ
jgi:mRNA interferase RelE/StbE